MPKVKFSNRFKKELELMVKRGKNPKKFQDVMRMFEVGERLPERMRDHSLQGEFKGFRECHIEPDWLLIYRFLDGDIVFENTGTHSDLFKK